MIGALCQDKERGRHHILKAGVVDEAEYSMGAPRNQPQWHILPSVGHAWDKAVAGTTQQQELISSLFPLSISDKLVSLVYHC